MFRVLCLFFVFCLTINLSFSQNNIETIVIIWHGEKPQKGLGQLNCQGLNRALALPGYLLKNYPNPNDIFAPNPYQKVQEIDGDKKYCNESKIDWVILS